MDTLKIQILTLTPQSWSDDCGVNVNICIFFGYVTVFSLSFNSLKSLNYHILVYKWKKLTVYKMMSL